MRYLPRKVPRTLLAGLLALAGAGAVPAAAGAEPDHHAGYVYVDDNTAGHNTIAAFARHADGASARFQAPRSTREGRARDQDSRRRARSRSRAIVAM